MGKLGFVPVRAVSLRRVVVEFMLTRRWQD
jgi:hypothetical protein